MHVNAERILKDASGIAEDLAARSKKIYEETVDRLPEGSERYAALALGGLVLVAGAFIVGRSRKKETLLDSKPIKDLDFKPFYRLARLWLIARMVD